MPDLLTNERNVGMFARGWRWLRRQHRRKVPRKFTGRVTLTIFYKDGVIQRLERGVYQEIRSVDDGRQVQVE